MYEKSKLIEMYLDWVNNFLSLEKFAEYYELGQPEAQWVIDQGRGYHEENIRELKGL